MRAALAVLAACCVALGARGAAALLVCSGTNYCEAVSCKAALQRPCAWELRPNASACGCCPGCVRVLDVGAHCPGSNNRPHHGSRITWECIQGTECINHRCITTGTTTEITQI